MTSRLDEIRQKRKAAMGGNGESRKPAPFMAKVPAAEEPVIEDDQATTTEIPAKRPRSPDDTRTTLEVDLTAEAKRSASDLPPEAEPERVPVSELPPPPRVAPHVIRREPQQKAVEIADPEESAPRAPDQKDLIAQIVERLKPVIDTVVGRKVGEVEQRLSKKSDESASALDTKVDGLSETLSQLQKGLAGTESNIEAIVMELDGSEEHDDDAIDVDDDGKVTERRPSIRKALRQLSGLEEKVGGLREEVKANAENVETLITELEGTEGGKGDIVTISEGQVTGREPSVRKSLGQIQEASELTTAMLRALLGKQYGRLQSFVDSHEIQTRKVLTKALRAKDYLVEVEKVAIEQEPDTVRTILEVFAEEANLGILRLALAQEQNSSIEKLDDPKYENDPQVQKLRKWVDDSSPLMASRAAECLEKLDWERCEDENRKLVFDGGDA